MKVPQVINNDPPYDSSMPLLSICPKEMKTESLGNNLHLLVYCSNIYYYSTSQDMESTCVHQQMHG